MAVLFWVVCFCLLVCVGLFFGSCFLLLACDDLVTDWTTYRSATATSAILEEKRIRTGPLPVHS